MNIFPARMHTHTHTHTHTGKQNDVLPERSRSLLNPALHHPSTLTPALLPTALTPTQTGPVTFARSPTHVPTLGPNHPPSLTPLEPQLFPTLQFYGSTNNSNRAEGVSSPNDTTPQPVSDYLTDSNPTPPPQKKPEKTGKKPKSKRGRRPKAQQAAEKRRRQSESRAKASAEDQCSEESVLTPVVNSDRAGLPSAPLNFETGQRTSNATPDATAKMTPPHPPAEQRHGVQGDSTSPSTRPFPPGGQPFPPRGLVTVKQEPLSNHEEEMELERRAAASGGGGGQQWPHPHHVGSQQSPLPKNTSKVCRSNMAVSVTPISVIALWLH